MSTDTPTTRAEHYAEAQRLLRLAAMTGDGYAYTNSDTQASINRERAAGEVARAHVHAILATAAPEVGGETEQPANADELRRFVRHLLGPLYDTVDVEGAIRSHLGGVQS